MEIHDIDSRAVHMLGIGRRKSYRSMFEAFEAVHQHLTFPLLESFRDRLGQSRTEFSGQVGISERTLSRYAKDSSKVVSPVIAERAFRIARLNMLASFVLESKTAGREWLATAQPGLGDEVPNQLLSSELGSRLVESLLQRIEYGAYT